MSFCLRGGAFIITNRKGRKWNPNGTRDDWGSSVYTARPPQQHVSIYSCTANAKQKSRHTHTHDPMLWISRACTMKHTHKSLWLCWVATVMDWGNVCFKRRRRIGRRGGRGKGGGEGGWHRSPTSTQMEIICVLQEVGVLLQQTPPWSRTRPSGRTDDVTDVHYIKLLITWRVRPDCFYPVWVFVNWITLSFSDQTVGQATERHNTSGPLNI